MPSQKSMLVTALFAAVATATSAAGYDAPAGYGAPAAASSVDTPVANTPASAVGTPAANTPTAAVDTPVTNAPAATPAPQYTTEFVTHLTTYCPEAATHTFGGSTFTITSATMLTVSDCSCTLTNPMPTAAPTSTDVPVVSSAVPTSAGVPVASSAVTQIASPPASAAQPSTWMPYASASQATPTPSPASYTGAASSNNIAKGMMAGAAGAALLFM